MKRFLLFSWHSLRIATTVCIILMGISSLYKQEYVDSLIPHDGFFPNTTSHTLEDSHTLIRAPGTMQLLATKHRGAQPAGLSLILRPTLNPAPGGVIRSIPDARFEHHSSVSSNSTPKTQISSLIPWAVLGITVLLLFYVVYKLCSRQMKKQKRALELKVEKQTEKLEKISRKLKDLNKFKNGMRKMIVNDLENPLNMVLGFSKKPRQAADRHENIQYAENQMLNTVRNVLDVQKFEGSEVKLQLEDLNLREIAEEAIDQVRFLIFEKNLQMNLLIDESFCVKADKELIMRVFISLLMNAIRHTPHSKHITISTPHENEMELSTAPGFITTSVTDMGEKIPTKELDRIFDKFTQIRQLGKSRSSGLDLTFCKLVVEAHGGTIVAVSEKDKGTTFSFDLPSTDNPTSKLRVKKNEEEFSLPEGPLQISPKEKILIIPYLQELRTLKVYEAGPIRNILKEMPEYSGKNIQVWRKELNQAVFNTNKEKYEELVWLDDPRDL